MMLGEDPFRLALHLMLTLDPALLGIIRLSLEVSLAAVALATALGLPLGALLALARFPGRGALTVLINAMMGLPPVVVGWLLLVVFGVRGPVGSLLDQWFGVRLVFTTGGAALATAVMSFPLIVRAVRLGLEAVDPGLEEAARSLGAGPLDILDYGASENRMQADAIAAMFPQWA